MKNIKKIKLISFLLAALFNKQLHTESSLNRFSADVEFGKIVVNNHEYYRIELLPEMNRFIIPELSIKLRYLMLLDFPKGKSYELKYGRLADNNWYKGFCIRRIAYDGDVIGLNYGEMYGITYGYGLLTDEYKTFGFGIRLTPDIFSFQLFAPLRDIFSETSDDVYGMRIGLEAPINDNLSLFLGITGILEKDKNIDENLLPNQSVSADVLFWFSPYANPYIEIAKLMNFGIAASHGIKGEFGPCEYDLSYRVLSKEFKNSLYDEFYQTEKKTYSMKNEKFKHGPVTKCTLFLDEIASLSAKYECFFADSTEHNMLIKLNINLLKKAELILKYRHKNIDWSNFEFLSINKTAVEADLKIFIGFLTIKPGITKYVGEKWYPHISAGFSLI